MPGYGPYESLGLLDQETGQSLLFQPVPWLEVEGSRIPGPVHHYYSPPTSIPVADAAQQLPQPIASADTLPILQSRVSDSTDRQSSPSNASSQPYSEAAPPSQRDIQLRQRHRRRRAMSQDSRGNTETDEESAPLLHRRDSPTLNATSRTVDSSNGHASGCDHTASSTPQDQASPSSSGSASSQSGAASTNTSATTVSGGSGSGPSGPPGQSSTQTPSISGTSSNGTQVGPSPSPPPPPSGTAWLIGFFKAPPAIMLFCEIILRIGMVFQVAAATVCFLSSPQKSDGTFKDPDFLSLCANFRIQTTGFYVILFGISKLKEPYLGCWIVCVTMLSFVCSSMALGIYFVYTTLGDSLMTLAGLLQVWIWKMIIFKRREEDDQVSCGTSTSSRGC